MKSRPVLLLADFLLVKNFFYLYRPLASIWRVYDNSQPNGPKIIASGLAGHRERGDVLQRDVDRDRAALEAQGVGVQTEAPPGLVNPDVPAPEGGGVLGRGRLGFSHRRRAARGPVAGKPLSADPVPR